MGLKKRIRFNRQVKKALTNRLLSSLFVLFLLVTFVFLIIRLSPGSPMQKYISPKLNPELAEKISETYSLQESILQQYISFLVNLAKGDLGFSYSNRLEVKQVISYHLPFTAIFAFIVFLLEIVIAFFLVKYIYFAKSRLTKKYINKIGLGFYSMPSFLLALVLVYIFSLKLNILPSSDLQSLDFNKLSLMGQFFDYIKHLILPISTLVLGGFFVLFRYLHEKVKEISTKDYILKLRVEGLDEKVIFRNHIIPNALGPFIAISGIEIGILLSGTLITEVIFSLPGMGRLTVGAMLSRDYPLIVGITLVSGCMIICTNLLSDIIRAMIDKRTLKEFIN